MREDRVAEIRRFVEWLSAEREQIAPLVPEMLALPPSEWDGWLAAHPEALIVSFFQALVGEAQLDPERALALSELIVRYAESLSPPPEAAMAHVFLLGDAWSSRAAALLRAGDPGNALEAYERAAAVYRGSPVWLPELEAVESAVAPLRPGFVARLLRDTPAGEWPALAERTELRNPHTLRELSAELLARIDRVPLESLAIALLAAAIAESLEEAGRAELVARLRANAWKDLGSAYRYIARFSQSLEAFDRAEAILEPFATLGQELAVVRLARVGTLQETGRWEESMPLLAACSAVFRQVGDQLHLVQCGILEGTCFHRAGRSREALAAYVALLREPAGIDDLHLAVLHNNIGHSLVELGEFDAAEEHLGEALARFERLGRPLLMAKSQLARGRLMLRRGEREKGLAELHAAREQFLRQHVVEEAGLCGLDIVEALLAGGSAADAEALARRIVREFTAAQLNARAITALRYLSDAIAARKASAATVDNVRQFLRSLRTTPDAEFAA